jgi:hypothetical protein
MGASGDVPREIAQTIVQLGIELSDSTTALRRHALC